MPWKEAPAMSNRAELVERYHQGEAMTVLAKSYGVSRKTAYTWVQRAGNPSPFADHSRRPASSPTRTSAEMETMVVAIRTEHATWGGRKIHHRLDALGVAHPPAPSTITGILRRHGLLRPATAPHRWTRFEAVAPNDRWQRDFKGWHALRTGRVTPLTLLDDHSRFLLSATCLPNERAGPVQAVLTAVFRRYGLPWAVLCDNGSPWGSSTPSARTRLGAWFIRLDIRLLHGRPSHPQTHGKLERLHRTLKAEVFAHRTSPDLATAQDACDQFRHQDHLVRPHQALADATPVQRDRQSPRAVPEEIPEPEDADNVPVRQVSNRGHVRLHGHKIAVGEGLAGLAVGLRPTATDGVWEVLYYNQVIRTISLHPQEGAA
jgi:transposase InsO family protein